LGCGCIGHMVEECGDGVLDLKECNWGDWLLWKFEPLAARGGGDGCY
jgi:hypothetical protein